MNSMWEQTLLNRIGKLELIVKEQQRQLRIIAQSLGIDSAFQRELDFSKCDNCNLINCGSDHRR